MEIDCFPNERILRQTRNVVLTTKRVRRRIQDRGVRDVVSMTLDSVTSCRLTTVEYRARFIVGVILIGLAALAIIASGTNRAPRELAFLGILLIIAGLAFVVSYFTSRHLEVDIRSPTARIFWTSTREAADGWWEFINDLEEAKAALMFLPAPGLSPAPPPLGSARVRDEMPLGL